MYWYESWTITKAKHWRIWCFWIVVLQKILESPLESKDIKPVNPKGNQTWIFIRRTDAEAEVPILWPPDSETRLIGKDPDARKDWKQRRKRWQRMRWLEGNTNSMHLSLSKLRKIVKDRETQCAIVRGITKSQNLEMSDNIMGLPTYGSSAFVIPPFLWLLHRGNLWVPSTAGLPPHATDKTIQYDSINYWKVLSSRWTQAVQTCIIQGSIYTIICV